MMETILLSITAFIGTNIDDIFLNTLFFTGAKTKSDERNIVLGKYIGIGALVFFSILGAFGLQFLPPRYIGWLGLVPIGLGVKEILTAVRSENADETDAAVTKSSNKIWNTALITMASGADNIGIYVPLFAGFAAGQILLAVCVFLILIAVWCQLGRILANLPVVKNSLEKYRTAVVPVVYIALGVYILWENL